MSLNDLMPMENIVAGDGREADGWGWDNPFAHIKADDLGDLTSNIFPSPMGGLPTLGANIVAELAGDKHTTLPIKHPRK